jgi:hypothetical protein
MIKEVGEFVAGRWLPVLLVSFGGVTMVMVTVIAEWWAGSGRAWVSRVSPSPRNTSCEPPMMICIIVLVALFVTICPFAAAAECADTNENCSFWASQGECQSNPGFMHSKCPLSCGTCVEMKEEDLALIQSVANYGKEQVVQVSSLHLSYH